MAGLVRPKNFPIRDPKDNKQENGIIYNPKRFPLHGGFTDAAKYPKGDAPSDLMDIQPVGKQKGNPAEVASKKPGGD